MLQHDRQLKLIAKSIEKTIKNELSKMLKNEREKYEEFYKAFGLQLKAGVYTSYGMNKDTLCDLLMFYSSSDEKLTTLEEYVSRMREDQKFIYYATGESIQRIKSLPQTEMVLDKGYEILYLTENVDEFAIKMLNTYKEKQFKSISAGDLDIETPEEKEEIKAKAEENKEMFGFMKEALGDKVKEVRLSQRLKSHPFCLTSDGDLSLEMEKVLNAMPTDNKVKAERVLEINPDHSIFTKLQELFKSDKDKLKKYTELLYTQSLLIEGLSIENPVEFSNMICDLMTEK
jgi:molecular chaperone HtpG